MADVPVGVVVVDGDGGVVEMNRAARMLLRDVAQLGDALAADDRDRLRAHLRHVQASERDMLTHLHLRVRGTPTLLTSRNDGTHVTVVLTDVSVMQQRIDDLEQRSLHDALTGLPNRTLFAQHLEQALRSVVRTRQAVALLFIDVDNFKLVNDTHGHAVGDEVLVAVADRMRDAVRPTDVVARLGGDEFVAMLAGAEPDEPVAVAERVLGAVGAEEFETSIGSVAVSVSIGVSVEEPGADPDRAVGRADTAMYAAKARGRSQVVVWEPDLGDALAEAQQVTALAAKHRELQARYSALIREARRDSRTGLQDEAAYQSDVQRLEESGEDHTVLFADLDHFHEYNDRYTHIGGHEALAFVAEALQKAVGERGVVYRYGGEEFTALLPRSSITCQEAEALARSLPAVVADLQIAHELSPFGVVTISVGAAHRSRSTGDVTRAADEMMLRAKAAGRNQTFIAR